jgi:hypothetical protein
MKHLRHFTLTAVFAMLFLLPTLSYAYTNEYTVSFRVEEDEIVTTYPYHYDHERIADFVSGRIMQVPNYLAVFHRADNDDEITRICATDSGVATATATTAYNGQVYVRYWLSDCNVSGAASDADLRRWDVYRDTDGDENQGGTWANIISSSIAGTPISGGYLYDFGNRQPATFIGRTESVLQVYTDHFRDIIIMNSSALYNHWGETCDDWDDCTGRLKIYSKHSGKLIAASDCGTCGGTPGQPSTHNVVVKVVRDHIEDQNQTPGEPWNFQVLLHELAHSAHYSLWKGVHRNPDYCYPNTGSGCNHAAETSLEWGRAAFQEGLAYFLAGVAQFYKDDCDATGYPLTMYERNIEFNETAGSISLNACQVPGSYYRFRNELNFARYLWDLYDSYSDCSNWNTLNHSGTSRCDNLEISFATILSRIASFCSGTGNMCSDETYTYDGSTERIDQPNPRDLWQIFYINSTDTLDIYYMNCLRDFTETGSANKGWVETGRSPVEP